MSKLKALQMIKETAEAVTPKAKKLPWWAESAEDVDKYKKQLADIATQDRQKAAKIQQQTQIFPEIPKQEGPKTLAEGSNKSFDPALSGKVDYFKKSGGSMSALAPLGAAEELFQVAKESPLGEAATKWSSLKNMIANKLAGQLDLSGGKDKQFQENATDVLSTALDPINVIPGVGGLAATGALEMLSEDKKKKGK